MQGKLKKSEIFYVACMLFSIFFGAGNMIFPPSLGQQAGTQAGTALLGFIITDAGLAVLAILAVVMAGSDMNDLVGKAGKRVGIFLSAAIYLLIGPLFALPRTGSVSFEIGITPFLPEGAGTFVPMLIYTAVFFSLTYYFSLKPSKIIDIVGKVMTPFLLLSIACIFVLAVINPLGQVVNTAAEYQGGPFVEGLLQGYLALDGFAAPVFAIIIISNFRQRGISDRREIVRSTMIVGAVAVFMLCLVYGALCYIGAQTSSMEAFANGGQLLSYAVHQLFGKFGNVILTAAVILACMTTSIGLTTSFGEYFYKKFPHFSYKRIVLLVTIFTWAISNVGLSLLLTAVLPVLVVVYPLLIVLVLLSFFDRLWKGRTEVYIFSMVFALAFSVFDGFKTAGISLWGLTDLVMKLPLADMGIGWVIPSFVGFLIGVSPMGAKIGRKLRK